MHNPPHPGELVREDCLEPLGLSVTDAAQALGVSRKTLSQILNGRAGISADMAVRLSKAFGSTPRHWLQLQMNYDLWHAEQRADELAVERVRLVGVFDTVTPAIPDRHRDQVDAEVEALRQARRTGGRRGRALVARMRGRAQTRLTTDEIMALTRGDDE